MDRLTFVLNFPVNARLIQSLVADEKDFLLMMPSAELPFNEAQWNLKLDPAIGTLSFFVKHDNKTIGHFSFLRVDQERQVATLGLVYLHPEYRRTGLSKKIIQLAEKTAADLLGTKTILLNVRTFNAPAYHLYLKEGYLLYEQTEDLIRMKKDLQFH